MIVVGVVWERMLKDFVPDEAYVVIALVAD